MSIIREFLNGPRPPGGSSAQLPSHLTPQRTGHKSRTHADSTSATGAQTSHGGDRGWWWVQHERETVRRPTSHERAVHLVAEPPIARVACIFGLTARVRLLAPSAPVPGLAPTQIPPKGGLGPRREGKSGSSQKCPNCSRNEPSLIRRSLSPICSKWYSNALAG